MTSSANARLRAPLRSTSKVPEPGHDGVGVQVLAGAVSGEQPWAVLVGGGQVRPILGVLTDQFGECIR